MPHHLVSEVDLKSFCIYCRQEILAGSPRQAGDLQQYYLKSGWLESYGFGVFKRPNENVKWTGALNSIQRQTELPVHGGGLTSLSLQGLSHYVRIEKELLYLFSPQYVKLPKWFFNQEWSKQILHVKTKLLPADIALTDYSLDGYKI